MLEGVSASGEADTVARDVISGFGEIWSARLLAELLKARGQLPCPVDWLDARRFIIVAPGELGPVVQWSASKEALLENIDLDDPQIRVVTGFIARDMDGEQTTLGRNGSDFSASILGALVDAERISIWTDVDGVLSADPGRVPEATVIPELSYNEAMELAYFGARVIHPQTMSPAVANGIPIVIRNTFDPAAPGSMIDDAPHSGLAIKGVTSVENVALVNLEGTGMIGVPGTADRLFGALRNAGVSVILISQASSEHSICFAVPSSFADLTRQVVEEAFAGEIAQGQIQRVDLTRDCCIVAIVGDGMAGEPGVAARFFGTLGNAGINGPCDCSGFLRAEHLGSGIERGVDESFARGPFRLLSVSADRLCRADRTRKRGRNTTGSDGGPGRDSARAVRHRIPDPRHHGIGTHASVATRGRPR